MTDQTPADKFRDLLRRDLQAAMKARRRDEVSILRVLIGAIDNAEAEDLTTLAPSDGSSGHVAGGRAGAGSTEVARRRLSSADLQQILVDEVTALTDQATHYEAAENTKRPPTFGLRHTSPPAFGPPTRRILRYRRGDTTVPPGTPWHRSRRQHRTRTRQPRRVTPGPAGGSPTSGRRAVSWDGGGASSGRENDGRGVLSAPAGCS